MNDKFDFDYWQNPLYYIELKSNAEAKQLIDFLKAEKTPFTIIINGASYLFKTIDTKNTFIAGLESFLSLELPIDVLH